MHVRGPCARTPALGADYYLEPPFCFQAAEASITAARTDTEIIVQCSAGGLPVLFLRSLLHTTKTIVFCVPTCLNRPASAAACLHVGMLPFSANTGLPSQLPTPPLRHSPVYQPCISQPPDAECHLHTCGSTYVDPPPVYPLLIQAGHAGPPCALAPCPPLFSAPVLKPNSVLHPKRRPCIHPRPFVPNTAACNGDCHMLNQQSGWQSMQSREITRMVQYMFPNAGAQMRRFFVNAPAGAAPSPPPPPSPPSPRSRRGLVKAAAWSYPFSSMIFWICGAGRRGQKGTAEVRQGWVLAALQHGWGSHKQPAGCQSGNFHGANCRLHAARRTAAVLQLK